MVHSEMIKTTTTTTIASTQQTHGGALYYVVEVPRDEYDEYEKRRTR